jgi:hypothetical protein
MKLLYSGVSSPRNPVLIRLIETNLTDDYGKAKWKLVKIKEVPLPQPTFPLNIGRLPIQIN